MLQRRAGEFRLIAPSISENPARDYKNGTQDASSRELCRSASNCRTQGKNYEKSWREKRKMKNGRMDSEEKKNVQVWLKIDIFSLKKRPIVFENKCSIFYLDQSQKLDNKFIIFFFRKMDMHITVQLTLMLKSNLCDLSFFHGENYMHQVQCNDMYNTWCSFFRVALLIFC